MIESRAIVPTASASRYLQQLCKHWSHKFAVDFTPEHGRIELPAGPCTLDAEAGALRVALSVAEADKLPRLKDVVEEHIKRFAFRETLAFDWRDGQPQASADSSAG
jgi:uncharacterized protein